MPETLRFPAVLFDLDGTLLDTLSDIARCMNLALEQAGFPAHPRDAFRTMVGEGLRVLAARVLPQGSRDDASVESVMAGFSREYDRSWNRDTRPYPGVREMLDRLAGLGATLAVLSNKPHEFTVRCVDHYFPDAPFARVRGQVPGVPRKPDPAGALAIARELGLAPESFAYVGDSATDMKTARGAGMFPVGALWGFRTREEIQEAGARALAETPRDVLRVLSPGGRTDLAGGER